MKQSLCTVFTMFLTSLGALTQGAPPNTDEDAGLTQFYNKLDLNNNGKVTHDEFAGFYKLLFDKSDLNNDGLQDQTEVLRGRHFEIFDINKDGVISFEEELSVRDRHWAHFDAGKKGWINLDDFVGRGRGRADPDAYDYETTFTKMDADRDGRLTMEEYLAFWNEYFASQDTDGDEALSSKEHGHADSFDSFDADGDEKIDGEENAQVRKKDFKGLDKDSDGSLTQAEFVR